jgi:colicin import membrane protein
MTGDFTIRPQAQLDGNRWGLMLGISIVLHLSIFSAMIFLPGIIPSRDTDSVVYEVDLVQMPAGVQAQSPSSSMPEQTASKPVATAKKIDVKEVEKAPIEIEKIAIKKIKPTVKKEEPLPANVIEDSISKLKKKAKADDSDHVNNAIAELTKKTKSEDNHLNDAISQLQNKVGGKGAKSGASGTGAVDGLAMDIYKGEVTLRIYDNWTYTPGISNRKDLEAIVSLTVKEDGTIVEKKFIKKSKDSIFDQSVIKAIEKSNPLPPFPEGRRMSYDEIEVTFNLKKLMEN